MAKRNLDRKARSFLVGRVKATAGRKNIGLFTDPADQSLLRISLLTNRPLRIVPRNISQMISSDKNSIASANFSCWAGFPSPARRNAAHHGALVV